MGTVVGGRLSIAAAGFLLASLPTIACSAESQPGSSTDPLAIYAATPGGPVASALLGGVVELDGRCLYVVSARGERALLAFPEGQATWDEEQEVVFLAGGRIEPGTPVTVAGGLLTARDFDGWPVPPSKECDTARVWLAADVGPTVN